MMARPKNGTCRNADRRSLGGTDRERTPDSAIRGLRELDFIWEPAPTTGWRAGMPSPMSFVRENAAVMENAAQ